jgi:Uma2 family endonuclease
VAQAPTITPLLTEPLAASISIPLEVHSDDAALFAFCAAHPEWRVERTARGELLQMAPPGGEAGWRNARITAALVVWADQDGSDVAFGTPRPAFACPAALCAHRMPPG